MAKHNGIFLPKTALEIAAPPLDGPYNAPSPHRTGENTESADGSLASGRLLF